MPCLTMWSHGQLKHSWCPLQAWNSQPYDQVCPSPVCSHMNMQNNGMYKLLAAQHWRSPARLLKSLSCYMLFILAHIFTMHTLHPLPLYTTHTSLTHNMCKTSTDIQQTS